MLTNEERVRAILGNIKNWAWDIYPKFTIEKEDAKALIEYLRNDMNMAGVIVNEK